jgi:hypothetical protein
MVNILPRGLARYGEKMFLLDRSLMRERARSVKLINRNRPTDVLFELEMAERKET